MEIITLGLKIMSTLNDAEQATLVNTQMQQLKGKAHKLLECVRCFPPYHCGDAQPVYQHALDAFHNLWSFMHTHREALQKGNFMRRQEIGEIASKIAQLQYVYYLRHGEISYLLDSFKFYEFIHDHDYSREDTLERRVRLYARHILVALLLNRRGMVRILLTEMSRDVQGATGADNLWRRFMYDVNTFVAADRIALDAALHHPPPPGAPTADSLRQVTGYSYRLRREDVPKAPAVSSFPPMRHAVLAAWGSEVRLSELPLDVLRLMQATEWDPLEDTTGSTTPRKTILYEAHPKMFLAATIAAQHDGPEGSPFLVFTSYSSESQVDWAAVLHTLYSNTVLVVDCPLDTPLSKASTAPQRSGLTLTILTSLPGRIRGELTLFLAAPALCAWKILRGEVVSIQPSVVPEACALFRDAIEALWVRFGASSPFLMPFQGDPFLRVLLGRYVCYLCLVAQMGMGGIVPTGASGNATPPRHTTASALHVSTFPEELLQCEEVHQGIARLIRETYSTQPLH